MSSGMFKILPKNYFFKNDIRGADNKFLDFFRIGTFIDCTRMKL